MYKCANTIVRVNTHAPMRQEDLENTFHWHKKINILSLLDVNH